MEGGRILVRLRTRLLFYECIHVSLHSRGAVCRPCTVFELGDVILIPPAELHPLTHFPAESFMKHVPFLHSVLAFAERTERDREGPEEWRFCACVVRGELE